MYKCPRCGALLYLKDREDHSGEFYHCENCDKTYNYEHVPRFAKYHGSRSILNECPRCGSDIISKVGGPRGRFFGCVEFPTCDFAYSELLRRRDTPKQDTKIMNEKFDKYIGLLLSIKTFKQLMIIDLKTLKILKIALTTEFALTAD